MRQGDQARAVAGAIDIAPSTNSFVQPLGDGPRVQTPLLGMLAHEQNELQIRQKPKQSLAPQFGAFATRRQVAALGVVTGKQKPIGTIATVSGS